MKKAAVLISTVLSCVVIAGCAQTPSAPPGPPVVNATPPPLPRDPALGAPTAQEQAAETAATRRRQR
jgi:hypothetical protein